MDKTDTLSVFLETHRRIMKFSCGMLALWAVFFFMLGCNKERHRSNGRFDITGAWELVRIEYPDGRIDTLDAGRYTRCKIYDADSTYYSLELITDGDMVAVIPHEMARYVLNDSVYIENGRVTPFEIINDTTITTVWAGYLEVFRKADTMTESRKEEIRHIVRSYLKIDRKSDKLTNYVFSVSERELQSANRYLWLAVVLIFLVSAMLGLYIFQTLKHKRRLERQLMELREISSLRPQAVINAMKEAESDFFRSEYYMNLRKKIESGNNFTNQEWEMLENQLKIVYPDFSSALYQIYNLSRIEYHVCLLTKVRATPTEIAGVLKRGPSSISSIRGRLYHKVFGKGGGAKEWDSFILSL